jgi:hypothetical protein
MTRLLRQFDQATLPNDKGRAFVAVVKYVLSKIPGFVLHDEAALDAQRAHEIDLVYWNERAIDGCGFLGELVFVEAKGWSSPIGTSEISAFGAKLRERSLDFGIVVSAVGITGDPVAVTSAQDGLRGLLQGGIRIVVITRDDFAGLKSGHDVVQLLKRKLCQLTLRRTIGA